MVGCTKDSDNISEIGSDVAVSFSSAEINTRVSDDGTKWSAAESIGITMVNIGGDDGETIASNGDNVHYTSTNTEEAASVSFEVASGATALHYPASGSVKFYAYYPYAESLDGYIYTADIADQSQSIDLMTASTTGSDRETINEVLNFSHRLAMVTLEITPNSDITSLEGLTVSISGISTTAKYDIRTGEQTSDSALGGSDVAVTFNTTATADKAVATIIMLPETLANDAEVSFTLNGTTYTTAIPKGTTFEVGMNHTYNIALGFDIANYLSGSQISEWGTADESTLTPNETVFDIKH